MKKISLVILSLCSPLALANTYIGAGIQLNNASLGSQASKTAEIAGRTLDLQGADTELSGHIFAGHRFDNNVGLEFGYTNFEKDAEFEEVIDANSAREFASNIDLRQLSIALTYRYRYNASLSAIASLGVVHHDASFSSSYEIDVENGVDTDLISVNTSDDSFGGLASVGVVYEVYKNINVVAQYQYARTSVAGNSAFMLSASYSF